MRASGGDFLRQSAADFVSFQEVREPDPEMCRRLEQSARCLAWTAAVNPATRAAAGGASAGVAVLARRGHGLAAPDIRLVDDAYRDRLAVGWAGGVVKGGHLAGE